MRLREPPQIPVRSVLAVRSIVRIRAEGCVVSWIFPGFSREGGDGGVERGEHSGVFARGLEPRGDAFYVAGEAGVDAYGSGTADYVGEDYVAVWRWRRGAVAGRGWELNARGVIGVGHGLLELFGVPGEDVRLRGEKQARNQE